MPPDACRLTHVTQCDRRRSSASFASVRSPLNTFLNLKLEARATSKRIVAPQNHLLCVFEGIVAMLGVVVERVAPDVLVLDHVRAGCCTCLEVRR